MKYVIIAAMILHLLMKFFWDYGVDYSYRDRFERALRENNIQEVKAAYEGIDREETPAQNRYSLGMATVMLLWIIAIQFKEHPSDKITVLLEWWSFWVISDVVKELANMFNVLTWLFNNPVQKYLSEYVIFFLSGGWIWWRLRKRKNESEGVHHS